MGQGRDFVIEGDEYDSAFFDKTAKFLKYLPDIAVDQQRRVRSRGHLRGLRRGDAGVPPPGRTSCRGAGCCSSAPTARRARAGRTRGVARARRSAPATDVDWQAHDLEPAGASTRFSVAPRRVAVRQLRGAAGRRAQRAQRAGGDRRRRPRSGISAERIADGLRAFAGVKRRLEVVGVADGVTVYDDFAHHPTAVAETLAGLRASQPDGAHLGGVRAALGLVVPARLSGRLRARVRRRRRSADRAGLPIEAAGVGAAVDPAARARSARPRPVGARGRVDRRHRRRHRRGSIGRAISSC